jgi:CubicO group peptidase (beta-lactamase class C family)
MDLAQRLDAVIDSAVREERIVGTVALVARDGEVVYRRAAGFADREAGRPVREDDVFRLASLAKPVVAVAALALVERGKLGLDDAVTRWLPEFRPRLADGTVPLVTIRQLLTHTSGLGYRFFQPEDSPYHRAAVSDGLDQPGLSFEENARRLASVPLLAAPGTAWNYSLSFDVLGGVLEQVAGAPLPDVVRRWVTGPLGLRETGFAVSEPARLVVPYVDGTPRPVRMGEEHVVLAARFAPGRILDPRSYPSGGAGMAGTAAEFLAFLEALRRGGAPLLRAETLAAMTRNQIGAIGSPVLGDGWGFGFGVAVLQDPARARTPMSRGTFRWEGAYGHHWWVDPEARLSAVVLTNTALSGMRGPFPEATVRAVYGAV